MATWCTLAKDEENRQRHLRNGVAHQHRCHKEEVAALNRKIRIFRRALRLAAGELSTYRDTDKHPDCIYRELKAQATAPAETS